MFSETRKDGLWPSTRKDGFQPSGENQTTARSHHSLSFSRHRLRQLAFIQQIFTFAQPRLHRIAANVAHAVGKVIGIANQAVKVTPLPQFARAFQVKVDLLRRETFPTMQQIFQRPLWMRHHQQMHMVGHHDPRDLAAPLAIEISQRIAHDPGADRLTEDAFAMTRIQPALHLLRESFVVFLFLIGRVRRRIPFQPRSTLRLPLITKLLRYRVSQTKSDEVSRFLLLPVWEAVECLLNFRVRIKELHARNDGLWPSNIQPILL